MWDFYVAMDGDLYRLGMDENGGLHGPTATRTLGGGPARKVEWLSGPRAVVVHTEQASFLVSEDFQRVRELPPLVAVSPDGTLGFAFDGHRNAKDLVVVPLAPGQQPYVVAEIGWLPVMGCCFVPKNDLVVFVVSDPNSDKGRNLYVVPMEQLRKWGRDGVTRALLSDVDYDNLNGLKLGLPQDLPVNVSAIQEHPGFFAIWHSRPTTGLAEASLLEIEYPYWNSDTSARQQVRLTSRPVTFDRFFISSVDVRRNKKGGRVILATGSAKKASDFLLAVRHWTLHESTADLRLSLADSTFAELKSRHIELRHAGGVDCVFALPNGRGVILQAEAPDRKRRLYRVDVGPNMMNETLIDFDGAPEAVCLVAEDEYLVSPRPADVRPDPGPGFGGTITKLSLKAPAPPPAPEPPPAPATPAVDPFGGANVTFKTGSLPSRREEPIDDVVDADFTDASFTDASTGAAQAAAAPAAAAPAAAAGPPGAGWKLLWTGTLPVVPGAGLDLPVGMAPADALVVASVVAVGDAKSSGLRHWLSQSSPTGDALYQIHLRSEAMVQARCAVYTVQVA